MLEYLMKYHTINRIFVNEQYSYDVKNRHKAVSILIR